MTRHTLRPFLPALAALGLLGLPLFVPTACPARDGDRGVAQKPYLGWSSWSFYQGRVTEAAVKAQADVLAARFKPFGYEYVNVDDAWQKGFDGNGYCAANPDTFPDGIAALAGYVHAKRLKFGLYLTPGIPAALWALNPPIKGTSFHIRDITDVSRPGSTKRGTYKIDYARPGAQEYVQGYADLLASWGVDFLKMDFVGPGGGNRPADTRDDLRAWSAALNRTSRPVWLELSNSLKIENIKDWKAVGNGWRIGHDIERYHTPFLTSWGRAAVRFGEAPLWAGFAGPGGWNDFDSLELGNGDADGLSPDERRSIMTLWAISCAPLYSGADLTRLDPGDYALLTDRDVLGIDQAGRVATPLSQTTPQQAWRVQNADGSWTVALFNLADTSAPVAVTWRELGLAGAASLTDLWTHADLGRVASGFSDTLAPHACRLLRVRAAARR